MPAFLTPEQVNAIKRIIEKRHAAIILRVLGADSLTTEERGMLLAAGIPVDKVENAIKDAYLYGQFLAQTEKPAAKKMTYEQFQQEVAKHPVSLSQAEENAVQAASLHAGAHIRHLGAKVEQQAAMLVFKEDATLRSKLLGDVQKEVAGNVQRRESIGKLKKQLADIQKDWSRDWNRVAITEKTNALNRGVADKMAADHGDAWVFKRPMPDACKHCVKLHIGPDGHPRLFRLSQLEANGTNVGKKAADWLPVVGTVHPHCQCQLHRVPPGWGFDDDDELVPGGKGGIRYDSMDAMEKAAEEEDALQKAFKVEQRILFQGMPIAIEQTAGQLRPWKDADGQEGETRLLFAYGYIEGTAGADGGEYDCFVGPDPQAPFVYIVHQNKKDEARQFHTHRAYDEDKVMLGFPDPASAKAAYEVHYDRPEMFYGSMTQMPVEEFAEKVLQTGKKGSLMADGMVKGLEPSMAAAMSQMGNRAVSPTAGGINLVIGAPMNHAGAMTRPDTIKKLKEHLVGFTDKDRERYMMQIPNGAEVYNIRHTPAENVHPFVLPEQRIDLDEEARLQIPSNRKFLDNEIARRLALVAPNFVIKPELKTLRSDRDLLKGAPPKYTEMPGHKYIAKQWSKDHWAYKYAEQHGGKIVEHAEHKDMVMLKLPKDRFQQLQAFKKEHGLKFEPLMGSNYAMLPMTKQEAAGLKQAVKPTQLALIPPSAPAPKKPVQQLATLKPSDLIPVPAPPAYILQHGQAVTVKIKGEIIKATVVGQDGSDHAVLRDENGKRRLAPWKNVRKAGEKQPQINSYDKLPEGSIKKASPEHVKFVDEALSETMIPNGQPTRAYLDWLHSKGYEGYIVGGFTRDLLAGTAAGASPEAIKAKLKDHDIVASATVQTGKQMFKELGHGDLSGWDGAGIVIAYGPDRTDGVDFASMNQDGFFDWGPVQHADVEVAAPQVTWDQDMIADARRRDFSVNAVYYDVRNHAFLDPTGKGVEDSQNKFLRVVAGPKELAKNNNIAIRFWKFRIRGFTSDAENTATMRKSFEQHAKHFWASHEGRQRLADELVKAAGKGTTNPKPFLEKLQKVMVADGAGDLYDTYIDPLESVIMAKAKGNV